MASAHTHVAVGLLAGAGLCYFLGADPAVSAVVTMSSGGAALIPDIDMRDSAVSHVFGKLSVVALAPLRAAIIIISGQAGEYLNPKRNKEVEVGHRKITHTLFWAAGMWALIYFYLGHLFPVSHGLLPPYWPVRLLMPVGLTLMALRSCVTKLGSFKAIVSRRHLTLFYIVIALVIGYLSHKLSASPNFVGLMALAVGVGCASHAFLDAFYDSGDPLTWPLPLSFKRHVKLGSFHSYERDVDGNPRRRTLEDRFIGELALIATAAIFVLPYLLSYLGR